MSPFYCLADMTAFVVNKSPYRCPDVRFLGNAEAAKGWVLKSAMSATGH
jgi:hypothetical protein